MALRAFLKREVDPALVEAGWDRRRNEFRRIGVDGFTDTLGFVIDDRGLDGLLGFEMQYGIVSPFHREMLTAVADIPADPDWQSPSEALLGANVIVPEQLQPSHYFPYRWAVQSGNESIVGECLRRAITDEVIPTLERWHHPRLLAADIRENARGRFPGIALDPGVVLALLPLGLDEPEVQTALTQLNDYGFDERMRGWLATRPNL